MKTNLKLAFVTAASFWALAFWPSHEAHAQDPRSAVEIQKFMMCRDCPFPMKIADGVWIMPNEKLEVHIEKIRLPSRFEEVHVTLRDPETHEILARGMSKQKRGRKTATIQLFDKSGREVKGFVRFIDQEEDQIQAKFTCDECEIEKRLD